MQDVNADMMSTKLDDMMATIRQVNEQFKNAVSLPLLHSKTNSYPWHYTLTYEEYLGCGFTLCSALLSNHNAK